jgi:pantothenate kinase type III
MKRVLLAIFTLFIPALGLADAGDTRVMEVWNCTINEGKTADEVAAHNAKWLAFARQTNPEIRSYGLTSIVGESGTFMFADSYPDLAAWGAAKKAMESEQGQALGAGFDALLKCSKNGLHESTEH